METVSCAKCRRPLAPEERHHVAPALALMTSFAFAFMHGGMWAREELARPYCAPCRRSMTRLAVFLSAAILACAGVGALIFLRGP